MSEVPIIANLQRAMLTRGSLESALNTLGDLTSEGLFVVDPQRTVLHYNRRAEEITGFSADSVVGRPCVAGFRCPRCVEACHIFRQRVQTQGVTILRKDGSSIRVRKVGGVLRDDAGEIVGAVELFSEVAAPSAAEDLRWSGVDQALAALGRGAILVDQDGCVRRASSVVEEILGFHAEDLLGHPVGDVLGPDLFEPGSPFRTSIDAGDRPEGWRVSSRAPGGRISTFTLSGARIASDCGNQGYLLVVRTDPGGSRSRSLPAASTSEPIVDPAATALRGFEGMIAASAPMLRIFQLIEHLRKRDATVLITGESGTGKELVARAIHAQSPRAEGPFVAINCAALPGELLETELFGHARGAFTGAVRDKLGRFEIAGTGTLFLDEVGDLPLALQVKLLRVLQERVFERVGETTSRPFRARVVAATHHDLAEAVATKRFREDLYYRLNVVRLHLPPLRERPEDIGPLATHLLGKIARQHGRALTLSEEAKATLVEQEWPGNVRQLENALEFAATVCGTSVIHSWDLPPEIAQQPATTSAAAPTPPPPPALTSGAAALGSELEPYPSAKQIFAALKKCRHRRAEAAKLLGISRTTLWRRLREIGGSNDGP